MKRRVSIQGFTLIELILVMVLLSTMMAISAPRLARYFTGRSLKEESRRFLALTRYGRSEAISRSVSMKLWVNPQLGTYGLEPKVVFGDEQTEYIEFQLAENLSFNIDNTAVIENGRATIVFQPDGSIVEESLLSVGIMENDGNIVSIERGDYGLGFFIRDTRNAT